MVLFALMLAVVLSPVGAQTPPVDDDALTAFGISFSVFIIGSMMTAFGESVEGFTMEEDGGSAVVMFENLSLADLDMTETFGYTHIDGTIMAVQAEDGSDRGNMDAEFTLTGGPVTSLVWSVDDFNMNSSEVVDFTITADGKTYVVSSADLQGGF